MCHSREKVESFYHYRSSTGVHVSNFCCMQMSNFKVRPAIGLWKRNLTLLLDQVRSMLYYHSLKPACLCVENFSLQPYSLWSPIGPIAFRQRIDSGTDYFFHFSYQKTKKIISSILMEDGKQLSRSRLGLIRDQFS